MKKLFSLVTTALCVGAASSAIAQNAGLNGSNLLGNQTTQPLGILAGDGANNGSYLELHPNGSSSPGTIGYVSGHNANNPAGVSHSFFVRQTPTGWTSALKILQDGRIGIGTSHDWEISSRFTLGGGFKRITLDDAYDGSTVFGAGCLGFNAARQPDGYFGLNSDGAHNGGSVIWGDIFGGLNFATINSGTFSGGGGSQWMPMSALPSVQRMRIHPEGNVQIGQQRPLSSHADYKLAVDGKLVAKSVYVTSQGWADFVFEPDYKPMALPALETYLQQNKHLPHIPAAKEVEANGINVAEMNAKLLQSVEELTLHVIALNKRVQELEASKSGAAVGKK